MDQQDKAQQYFRIIQRIKRKYQSKIQEIRDVMVHYRQSTDAIIACITDRLKAHEERIQLLEEKVKRLEQQLRATPNHTRNEPPLHPFTYQFEPKPTHDTSQARHYIVRRFPNRP